MSGNNGDGIKFSERWFYSDFHEVADRLNINIHTLFEYINQDKIKMVFFSGRFRILDSEVERFMEQREKNMSKRGRPPRIKLRRRNIDGQDSRVDSTL